jgi:hypothetical protein
MPLVRAIPTAGRRRVQPGRLRSPFFTASFRLNDAIPPGNTPAPAGTEAIPKGTKTAPVETDEIRHETIHVSKTVAADVSRLILLKSAMYSRKNLSLVTSAPTREN